MIACFVNRVRMVEAIAAQIGLDFMKLIFPYKAVKQGIYVVFRLVPHIVGCGNGGGGQVDDPYICGLRQADVGLIQFFHSLILLKINADKGKGFDGFQQNIVLFQQALQRKPCGVGKLVGKTAENFTDGGKRGDFLVQFVDVFLKNLHGCGGIGILQDNLNLPDRNAQLAQQQNPAEAADGVFIIDAVGVALLPAAFD